MNGEREFDSTKYLISNATPPTLLQLYAAFLPLLCKGVLYLSDIVFRSRALQLEQGVLGLPVGD